MWISEVMLQQTRVSTVLPYYERFLARWPDAAALAAADPNDVRAAWSGLGYYRRAASMLEAAGVIVSEHGGVLPTDVDGLRRLPGFGRYTAGAVASICYDTPVPAVDGNVQRVLARLFGIEGDVTKGAASRTVWARATELVEDSTDAGDLNQSLIELGAIVCTWRNPACLTCPVRKDCWAYENGAQDRVPPPRARAKRTRLDRTALLVVTKRGRVLLEQQPEGGLFGGLWALPMVDGQLEVDAALDEAQRRYGLAFVGGRVAADVKNVLTHRDLFLRVVRTTDAPRRAKKPLVYAPLAGLSDFGIPTATVRALRAALDPDELAAADLPDRASTARRGRV